MRKRLGMVALALILVPVMVVLTACGGTSVPRDGDYMITESSFRALMGMSNNNNELIEELLEEIGLESGAVWAEIQPLLEMMIEMMAEEFEFLEDFDWAGINNVNQFISAYVTAMRQLYVITIEGNELFFPMFGREALEFEMDGRNVVFADDELQAELEEDETFSFTYRNGRFTLTFTEYVPGEFCMETWESEEGEYELFTIEFRRA